jgi:hypothetical protein
MIQDLVSYLVINLFKGDEPENWAQATLEWVENHPAKSWGWKVASIIDLQLNGIEVWDSLSAEEREEVAKEMIKYLESGGNAV